MPTDFLSEVFQFVWKHKMVIGFYLLIVLLLFVNRKKFQFQMKFIAIYRTVWGLGLMDRIASRYRELVKLLGYISIGAGFSSMLFILVTLGLSIVTLIKVPNSPALIAPLIPGVHIPGTPEGFSVPFVQGIIAIFIIVVVHEFAHGVVARAHNVKIKSSGPALIGPILAAFVEPDEKQLKSKDDVVQYSVFASGTFANIMLAIIIMALTAAVLVPLNSAFFPEQGVIIGRVTEGTPAHAAGLSEGMLIKSINGDSTASLQAAVNKLYSTRPNETVVFNNGTASFTAKAGANADFPGRGYFGIGLAAVYKNQNTAFFGIFTWIASLFNWVYLLSLGIGLANMIPIGPLDGGKMLHLALHRISGEAKANKNFIRVSMVLLLVILFLLSPIFRAILKSVAGFV